ncbi:MHYT domain-containing protein [Rhodococcus sp. NPDC058505]|uniref:MHYT domain-containing protein n=1 Tax=Rhodococcus sp. NPDC058505 TaxID=3346531 RepID=UPI003661C5C4
MGVWVLFLAYAVAVVGSLVGLICVQAAASASSRALRWRWIGFASLSIGGVAIWLMHFIAMTGFDLPGSPVRYDLTRTLLSVLLAVGATGFGLAVAGSGGSRTVRIVRLLISGVVMGLAVSLMHYTGMWAIRIRGSIDHDRGYVIASVVIGVVAATAALWFSRVATRWVFQIPAALVMGLAVVSLHYTGMAGVRVQVDPTAALPSGTSVSALLFPAFGIGMLIIAAAAAAVLMTPSKTDLALDAEIARWEEPVPDRADLFAGK